LLMGKKAVRKRDKKKNPTEETFLIEGGKAVSRSFVRKKKSLDKIMGGRTQQIGGNRFLVKAKISGERPLPVLRYGVKKGG